MFFGYDKKPEEQRNEALGQSVVSPSDKRRSDTVLSQYAYEVSCRVRA